MAQPDQAYYDLVRNAQERAMLIVGGPQNMTNHAMLMEMLHILIERVVALEAKVADTPAEAQPPGDGRREDRPDR